MNNNFTESINRNPFKFLDSYTKEDKDIFFGRETELEEIYRKFYKSKILLVYGKSGTGKSSIINCGLVSKIPSEDVLLVPVRCGKDPVNNLKTDLLKFIDTKSIEGDQPNTSLEILEEIYLENFKPITLLFDQFEEIFILASKEDRKNLVGELLNIINSKIRVNLVIIFREEYFASFSEFENDIPNLFENRVRIEKINKIQVKEIIEEPCKICNVGIEPQLAEKIAGLLSQETGTIELTYFQILMDRLYSMALERSEESPVMKIEDLTEIGDIGNILGDFLNSQLIEMENATEVEAVLKAMISEDGTKKRVTPDDITDSLNKSEATIPAQQVKNILQDLINRRIVSEKDEQGFYEIKHDSLAQRIYDRLTADERKLKEIQLLLKNAYKQYDQVGTLINERTLRFVEPYIEKLVLPPEINDYINKSNQAILKQKRRKRRLAVITGSLIVALAVIISIFSFRAKEKAKLQTQIEKSKSLANKAMQYIDDDPTLAFILAEKAWKIHQTYEAKKAIFNSYQNAPFSNQLKGNNFVISESGNLILSTTLSDNNIRLYNYKGTLLATCVGHTGDIDMYGDDIRFSPDEKYILSQCFEDSTIKVWDLNGKQLLEVKRKKYSYADILPNSQFLYFDKEGYRLYDIENGIITKEKKFTPVLFAFGVKDNYSAIIKKDHSITLFNLINDSILAQNVISGYNDSTEIKFSNNKKHLLIKKIGNFWMNFRTYDNIILWNWEKNKMVKIKNKAKSNIRNTYFDYNGLISDFYSFGYYDSTIEFLVDLNDKIVIKANDNKNITENFSYLSDDSIFYSKQDIQKSETYLMDISNTIKQSFKGIMIDNNCNYQKEIKLLTKEKINDEINKIRLYDINGSLIQEFISENIDGGFFKDKEFFYLTNKEGRYELFDYQGKSLFHFNQKTVMDGDANISYLKDNYFLTKGNMALNSNILFVDSLKTYSFQQNIKPQSIYFTNNEKNIICIDDLYITVWDIKGTKLAKTKISDLGDIFGANTSPDSKYLSVFYWDIAERVCTIEVYNLPDLTRKYITISNSKLEFFEDKEFFAAYCVDGEIKYLNNQFETIDKWKIIKHFWMQTQKDFFSGKINKDSTFRIYDAINKDSIVFNLNKNNFWGEIKVSLSKNNLYQYDNNHKRLFILNFKKDTIKQISQKGEVAKFVEKFDRTGNKLIIWSYMKQSVYTEEGFYNGYSWGGPTNYEIWDLTRMKEITEFSILDQKYDVEDFSLINNTILLTEQEGYNYTTFLGNSIIKFKTEVISKISPNDNYIAYYDEEYKRIRIFPLKPEEIIRRVREEKEFGEIRRLTEYEKKEYGIID